MEQITKKEFNIPWKNRILAFFEEDPFCIWTQKDLMDIFHLKQGHIAQELEKLEKEKKITSWEMDKAETKGITGKPMKMYKSVRGI